MGPTHFNYIKVERHECHQDHKRGFAFFFLINENVVKAKCYSGFVGLLKVK